MTHDPVLRENTAMIPGYMIVGQRRPSAAGAGFTYATWNPSDKSATILLSNGNRTATRDSAAGSTYRSVRATKSVSAKAYWEITVAWGATGAVGAVGLCLSTMALDSASERLGLTANDVGCWGPNNTVFINLASTDYTNGNSSSATYGIAYDPATGKGWVRDFSVGSSYFGGGDPAAGTSPTFTLPSSNTYFPAITALNTAQSFIINAGQAAFSGSAPSGFGNL